MRQRRKLEERVTIADLAKAYDKKMGGKAPKYRATRPVAESRFKPKNFTVSQGDVRLSRLKARADGIRFALQHEKLDRSKVRELEQVLHNLELAIRGMTMSLKES